MAEIPLPFRPDGRLPRESMRAVGWFTAALLAVTAVIMIPFWFGGTSTDLLVTITPALQWLPLLVMLGVHLATRRGTSFLRQSALTPVRPFGPIARTSGLILVMLVAVPVVTIAGSVLVGAEEFTIADGAGSAALMIAPLVAVTMILTVGEEVAWRGYLATLLAPWGFWRASGAIAALWSLWHLPLTATYLLDGAIPGREVLATTVNLFLSAFVLSAVRYLSGSVWPAVLGHALLNTVLVYAYANFIIPTADLGAGAYWLHNAVSWVVWGAAIVVAVGLVARSSGRPGLRAE
ncbi:CAAX protease self-immunity [Ruania alba]|uniref:CAAX protease self-immunity n=2 Tax=Ruania alba TaxID=648782 RepID=A0A1H5DEN3_9MICO|nr:CAAX protease self-immunity [Ruania alba]